MPPTQVGEASFIRSASTVFTIGIAYVLFAPSMVLPALSPMAAGDPQLMLGTPQEDLRHTGGVSTEDSNVSSSN